MTVLDIPIQVAELIDENTPKEPFSARAISDTGASGTVISHAFARKMNLSPTGAGQIAGIGIDDFELCDTYLVAITPPNNVVIKCNIAEVPAVKDADLLIGMDIIALGDSAITNHRGRTVLSFQVPSSKEIDFVPETNREISKIQARNSRVQPKRKARKHRPK